MNDIWTYREAFGGGRDVVGFSVAATDGGIGKVDEASYDAGAGHIVVDTGPWILGRRVVLPAGVIERVDWDAEVVHVDRSKDEIKAAPEFEGGGAVDDALRERVGGYFLEGGRGARPFGGSGGIG